MPLTLTKRFCATFFLIAFLYQVESVPAYQAAAQSNQSANAQASPTVEQPLSETKTPVASNDTEPASDEIKRAEWVQIFINSFVALIVLWQAWTYYQERKILEQQVSIAQISERAYIGVTSIKTVDFTIGKIPVVKITILNGGRTPAWRVKVPMTLRIGDVFPSERPELGNVVGSAFLPAGVDATFSAPFTFVLTPQWKAALESGDRTAFIHGEVHYDDCWGSPQIFPFKFVCRKDGTWKDYKDHNQTEPIIEITP